MHNVLSLHLVGELERKPPYVIPRHRWRIILNRSLKIYDITSWTVFVYFRIGTNVKVF